MDIRYYANLGEENANELVKDHGVREAVLLSAPGAAPRTIAAAVALRKRGLALAADNGNTAAIFQIADEFAPRAEALREAASKNGHLPAETRFAFRALARDVAIRCAEFAGEERQRLVLEAQTAIEPAFFTCLEDLTIPVLTQLAIDRRDTGQRRSTFVALQQRGLQLAADVLGGKCGTIAGQPYATLHAIDYDSAVQVGRRAAMIDGLEGIATGLASFLNDRSYIDSYVLGGRTVRIAGGRKVPARLLQSLLVTLGMLDGFAAERARMPRFHGLGAGAPIILPLLALCAYGSPLLSVDSTSPEKNASMGKLVVNQPAPLTLRTAGVAQALVEGRRAWDCPCPACRELQRELPFDLKRARAFYTAQIAPREIEDADLETDDGIGRSLSICWQPASGPTRKMIVRARTNHNHWAIAEMTREMRERLHSYDELREWVGAQCDAYRAQALPVFGLQIEECLRLIDRLRPIDGRH